MSALTVYPDNQPQQGERFADFGIIQSLLNAIGVRFERWESGHALAADADQADVLAAYAGPIDSLMRQYRFQSIDVAKLTPEHPEKAAFRQKFLAEHVHNDFEARFFVEGSGLFYLHAGDKVYAVLCEQGDLISVPANTPHWFDMGENPRFTCIRLFTTADGWIADFTGSGISTAFPTLDEYVAGLS
jgi:1,2-dihydroxy-3-keto-5-methylthiopentene dioxygenase